MHNEGGSTFNFEQFDNQSDSNEHNYNMRQNSEYLSLQSNARRRPNRSSVFNDSTVEQQRTPSLSTHGIEFQTPQRNANGEEEKHMHDDSNVKNMSNDLNETNKILTIVTKFESEYFESKQKYNEMDAITMNTDINIKTMSHCYKLLKKNVFDEHPNFDNAKMNENLQKMVNKVKSINLQYSQIKGEYMAVQDQILNKDTFSLKLGRVQAAKQKQNEIFVKIDEIDDYIYDNEAQVNKIKASYEDFEQSVFELVFDQIKNTMTDVDSIFNRLNEQLLKLQSSLSDIEKSVESMKPQNAEQGKKLDQIHQEIFTAQQVVKSVTKQLEKETNEKMKLIQGFKKSQEIVNNIIKYSPWQDSQKLNLVELVKQTRTIEVLKDNQIGWKNQLQRLQALQQNDIAKGEANMQLTLKDTDKFIHSTKCNRKDEHDGLIKSIQIQAKQNGDSLEQLQAKLDNFEQTALDFEVTQHIPDQDILFLNKEVNRFHASIASAKAHKDQILAESMKIENEIHLSTDHMIHPDDIEQLTLNLKDLQKQKQVAIEHIITNVESLNQYSSKSLKNKVLDENKAIQQQMALLKEGVEELKKLQGATNQKLNNVKSKYNEINQLLNHEDKQKDNELEKHLGSKIKEFERKLNGNRGLGDSSSKQAFSREFTNVWLVSSDHNLNLEQLKSQIAASIQSTTQQFNDNNGQVQKLQNESPTHQKGCAHESEMNILLKNINQIQGSCNNISDQINKAKEFVGDIDSKLDELVDPGIKDLRIKFMHKNKLVEECDQLFDSNEILIKQLDKFLTNVSKDVVDTCQKVHEVSPMDKPSSGHNQDNRDFIQEVTHKHQAGQKLKDLVHNKKDYLESIKDQIVKEITPLNELGEREIHQPQVEEILQKMKEIERDLQNFQYEIKPLDQESSNLNNDFKRVLDNEKNKKLKLVSTKLGNSSQVQTSIDQSNNSCVQKLDQYKNEMSQARSQEALHDQNLYLQLQSLEQQLLEIKTEQTQQERTKVKLNQTQQQYQTTLNNGINSPESIAPFDLDKLIDNVDLLIKEDQQCFDKMKYIEVEIDIKLMDLANYVNISRETKTMQDMIAGLNVEINDMHGEINQIHGNLNSSGNSLHGLLQVLETQLDFTLQTLEEMKNGAKEESQDYWDQRDKINNNIALIQNEKQKLGALQKTICKHEHEIEQIHEEKKNQKDLESISRIAKNLKVQKEQIEQLLNQGYAIKDLHSDMRKQMHDCNISLTIKMRANELQQFMDKFTRASQDFQELKSADEEMNSTKLQDFEITNFVNKLESQIRDLESEKQQLQHQNQKLETYSEKDFISQNNAKIIKEIRQFKDEISQAHNKLKEIENLENELNTKLIMQDFNNAIKLFESKAVKLRNRLDETGKELKKINECGQEMDGNTSNNEEDEFINALSDEMPDVFNNIEDYYSYLDQIDGNLKEVSLKKKVDEVQILKMQIDQVSTQIEQCEALVIKLDTEIIEWDSFKKLLRRDEELSEIEVILQEVTSDLQNENNIMNQQLETNKVKLGRANIKKNIEEYTQLIKDIKNYQQDIYQLQDQIDNLKQQKDKCFEQFDIDIPLAVKQNRKQGNGLKFLQNFESNRAPCDIYQMLKINCKYKHTIKEMLKYLRHINQQRKKMETRYVELRYELEKNRDIKHYKVVKGDPIDELFGKHLDQNQIIVPVRRTAPGKYQFGSKQIQANIINNKLVIRVGGGYMSADAFIEQYGRAEIYKILNSESKLPTDFQYDVRLSQVADAQRKQVAKMNRMSTSNIRSSSRQRNDAQRLKETLSVKNFDIREDLSAQFNTLPSKSPRNKLDTDSKDKKRNISRDKPLKPKKAAKSPRGSGAKPNLFSPKNSGLKTPRLLSPGPPSQKVKVQGPSYMRARDDRHCHQEQRQ